MLNLNPNITPEFITLIFAIVALLFKIFKQMSEISKHEHRLKLFQREFKIISCFILEKNLTSELWSYVEKNNKELKNNDEIIH
jgi:hypothetical protein